MSDIWVSISEFLYSERASSVIRAVVVVVLGFIMARVLGRGVARAFARSSSPQRAMLARRLIVYAVVVLAVLGGMRELGFDLGVLLGAAGILTVAIGFASQTSASNLISGLFLVFEQPFVVGDIITVSGVTGEVLSIDLLSVKLRTFENLFVRVPSETLIKTILTNNSRFPIRRFDMLLSIARDEDMERVSDILRDLATAEPLVLAEPPPQVFFLGFGESSTELKFVAWAVRECFYEMRNTIQPAVKRVLDDAGVRLALPHRVLQSPDRTPFTVDLRSEPTAASAPESSGSSRASRPADGV